MDNPATIPAGFKRCKDPACEDPVKPLDRFLADVRCRGGYRHKCRDCENADHRAADQAASDRIRELVFGHYGRACACCGSTELLTIDHMNPIINAQLRRYTGRGGVRFYRWLIRQGLPPGYQTLCQLCNASKGTGPVCRRHGTPPRCSTCGQLAPLVDSVMAMLRPLVEAEFHRLLADPELIPAVVPAAIRAWEVETPGGA